MGVMQSPTPVSDSLHAPREDIERACRSIKGIAHPIRLEVLCILGDREMAVKDLAAACDTSQSNISSHLGILRDCGILEARRESHHVYYKISDPRMLRLMDMMRSIFCSHPH